MRRQQRRIKANESALLYWSDRLGYDEPPLLFREVVREHDPSLFNIAWERLRVAKMNGPVRDEKAYYAGCLLGMMRDRNEERRGR